MKCIKFFIFVILTALTLSAGDTFNLVDTWHPGDEVVGAVAFAIINDDGNIIATFYKSGNRVITPKKIIKFAPRGQGPGDLMDMMALFHHNNDIAFVERPEKVKIFKKEGETYKIKEIVWLKRGKYIHIVTDGIYHENKWFLAGYEIIDMDMGKKMQSTSFIKIYNDEGKPLKNLIRKTFYKPNRFYQMDYYVALYKDYIFFLLENELKVHLISKNELKVKKEVKLEVPGFYKKMPKSFYAWKKYDKPGESLSKDIDVWKTSYSRINKVLIENDSLVLQIRTCNDKLKRFALLFYNAENFKLEKTIFIDDLLLVAKDGKYYFFAKGNPGRDEGVEDFIINIYSFGEKDEKG